MSTPKKKSIVVTVTTTNGEIIKKEGDVKYAYNSPEGFFRIWQTDPGLENVTLLINLLAIQKIEMLTIGGK